MVLVKVAGSQSTRYDVEAARAFLKDLLVQLETHSPNAMRELRDALPEQAQREAMAARLREALPNLIALPWDPEAPASTNAAEEMLHAIARRLLIGAPRLSPRRSGRSWWRSRRMLSERCQGGPAMPAAPRAWIAKRLTAWRERAVPGNALGEGSSGRRSRAYVSLEPRERC